MALRARLPFEVCACRVFLNASLSNCGAAYMVAYAIAVCFLNVSLSVCGVECEVAYALVVRLPLR